MAFKSIGWWDTAGDIFVYRGLWNPVTQEIDWAIVHTFVPDYYQGFGGESKFSAPSIAFSPDGSVGYVAGIGDLIGGVDTAQTVWMAKSTNGGLSWGLPYAYDMPSNGELMDSLHIYQETYPVIDPITEDTIGFDTIFVGGDHPTVANSLDLVVDKNGIPHAIAVVGHGSVHKGDGSYSLPNYDVWTGPYLESYVLDFTIDSCGDQNYLYLGRQNHIYGKAGPIPMNSGERITVSPFVQASRSSDGELVLFSWTDSDVITDTAHDHPNLFTRGYDVQNVMMTPVRNHTSNDSIWAGKVLTPQAAPECLFDGNDTYSLPMVAMSMDGPNALHPVSYWYFSDIHFDRGNDFKDPPSYFYNCKTNPFSNSVTLFPPDCGMSNGEIAIIPGGGVGPYSLEWGTNALGAIGDTASNLAAGIYEIIVTDSKVCKDTISIVLNNLGAPEGMVDSIQHINCFGENNGQASIVLTNPTGNETFSWSNGEQSATAMNLGPGQHICTVEDTTNGCTSFFSVEISESSSPIQAQLNNPSGLLCFGDTTGELSVSASGGTGVLQYLWSTGDTLEQLTGLSAGTYSVVVMDENGCSESLTDVIEQQPEIFVNSIISPNTASSPPYTGNIFVSIGNGTAPYLYHYTSQSGFDTLGFDLDFLFGLCADTYFLTITDGIGCVMLDTFVVAAQEDGVACGVVSSIEEMELLSFEIFPNPALEEFQISVEMRSPGEFSLAILDAKGKLLQRRKKKYSTSYRDAISTQGWASGLYLVSVTTNAGTMVKKLIVL